MKFDEHDRRRVIRVVESKFGVSLKRIGRAPKYLSDENGVRYLILGGENHWHGISRTIFDEEEHDPADTVLVVATQDGNEFEIFLGPFQPLLQNKNLLSVNSKDHYVFHLHRLAKRLVIREIRSLELKDINALASLPKANISRTRFRESL